MFYIRNPAFLITLLLCFLGNPHTAAAARIGANEVQVLPIVGTRLSLADGNKSSVPTGATGVMINVTAVGPETAGFMTIWPCGIERPLASHLNFEPGQTIANGVIAAIGGEGEVCVYSTSATDLVVDIAGWFENSSYQALTPGRLLDTRQTGTLLSPTNPISLDVSDILVQGISGQTISTPNDVKSVSLNVTAVNGTNPGFITVWPCDQPRPNASNLNFEKNQIVANGVIASVGALGNTCLYASTPTHVVVDLNGWLSESTFVSVIPERLTDTRGTSSLSPPNQLGISVRNASVTQGTNRISVPSSAAAAALNLTAVHPNMSGFATVWPCDRSLPLASNVNFTPGSIVPNNVISPIATDGTVCVFSSASSDYVLDLLGWFIGGENSGYQGVVPTRLFDSRLTEPFRVDADADGVPDVKDAFPDDPTESVDTDGDGLGNSIDTDDDGDGVLDSVDSLPLDPRHSGPLFSEETAGIHILALNLNSILVNLTDTVNEDLLNYLNFKRSKVSECLTAELIEGSGSPYTYAGDTVILTYDHCPRDNLQLNGTVHADIVRFFGDANGVELEVHYNTAEIDVSGLKTITTDVAVRGRWDMGFIQGTESFLSIESGFLSFVSEGITEHFTTIDLNRISSSRPPGQLLRPTILDFTFTVNSEVVGFNYVCESLRFDISDLPHGNVDCRAADGSLVAQNDANEIFLTNPTTNLSGLLLGIIDWNGVGISLARHLLEYDVRLNLAPEFKQGRLELDTKEAIFNTDSGKLLAITSDSSANFANKLISIDPTNFQISALASITPDHRYMQLSSDYRRLYMVAGNVVLIYDTASFELIGSITPPELRPDLAGGYSIVDLISSPTASETIAIVMRHNAFQVSEVVIYDGDRLLPTHLSDLVSLTLAPGIAFSSAGDGIFVKTTRTSSNLTKYTISDMGFQNATPGFSTSAFDSLIQVTGGKIYVGERAYDEQSFELTEVFDLINAQDQAIDPISNRYYATSNDQLAIHQLDNAGNAETVTLSTPSGSHRPLTAIYPTPHTLFFSGGGETRVVSLAEIDLVDVPTVINGQAQTVMDTGQCLLEAQDTDNSILIFDCEATTATYDPIADKYYVGISATQEDVGPSIAIIDATSMSVDRYIQLSETPYHLDISANSIYLYISYDLLQRITRISLSNLEVVEVAVPTRVVQNQIQSRRIRGIFASRTNDNLFVLTVSNAGSSASTDEIVLFDGDTEIGSHLLTGPASFGDRNFSMAESGSFFSARYFSVNSIERFSATTDGLQLLESFALSEEDRRQMSQHTTTADRLFYSAGSVVNLNDRTVTRVDTDEEGFFHVASSPDRRTVYYLSATTTPTSSFTATAIDSVNFDRLGSISVDTDEPLGRTQTRLARMVVGDKHLLLLINNIFSGSVRDRSAPLFIMGRSLNE